MTSDLFLSYWRKFNAIQHLISLRQTVRLTGVFWSFGFNRRYNHLSKDWAWWAVVILHKSNYTTFASLELCKCNKTSEYFNWTPCLKGTLSIFTRGVRRYNYLAGGYRRGSDRCITVTASGVIISQQRLRARQTLRAKKALLRGPWRQKTNTSFTRQKPPAPPPFLPFSPPTHPPRYISPAKLSLQQQLPPPSRLWHQTHTHTQTHTLFVHPSPHLPAKPNPH